VGQRDGGGKNSDGPQHRGRERKRARRAREEERQKGVDRDTYKGGLGDTHIGRVERKGRDGEQDSVTERDRGSGVQGYTKAEVLGRAKNIRERKARVGSRRERGGE